MTKQDVIGWMESNLPTATENGETVVVVAHDTDGTTDCSICGRPHSPSTEFLSVDLLADKYHAVMEPHLPDRPSDAVQAAISDAEDKGTGHERYFQQVDDQ